MVAAHPRWRQPLDCASPLALSIAALAWALAPRGRGQSRPCVPKPLRAFLRVIDTPVLLVSLGTSPAIVPEAFLLPDVQFGTVRVLTTASVKDPDRQFVQAWFAAQAPTVRLSISRVADFTDFTSEQDHFQFEEVLYRWVLEPAARPEARFFCLSGGFKTMSAAIQKAAGVLGAKEVFHVLADPCCTNPGNKPRPPETAPEILEAQRHGHLHWIRLGPEAG